MKVGVIGAGTMAVSYTHLQVMETEAPSGYHLDATPVSFEVASEAEGEPAAMEVKACLLYTSRCV